MAPRINNQGTVIANNGIEGFTWSCHKGFESYCYNGYPTHFVAINNKGSILGFVDYPNGYTEWFIWSEHCSMREPHPPFLNLGCIEGRDVFFRGINDHGIAVGARRTSDSCYRSVFWGDKRMLLDLDFGILWDVNNNNYMVGSETCNAAMEPYLWHVKGGGVVLSDDVRSGKPQGYVLYNDPVIAPDDTVYGTLEMRDGCCGAYYGYQWNACDGIFRVIDIAGMRISAVNRCHQLVGSLCGKAVIGTSQGMPSPLIDLIDAHCLLGWDLIEATDINDVGQIVGYGTFLGTTYIIMLDPIR